jgi:hypothetical protein
VLDTRHPDRNGEYPVFVCRGGRKQPYAATFAEFLTKRISDPTG